MTTETTPWGGQVHSLVEVSRQRALRLPIFLGVFSLSAVVGLGYTFARPAEYRGTASLRVAAATPATVPGVLAPTAAAAAAADPARVVAAPESTRPAEGASADVVAGELRVLTSAPLLGAVVRRLQAEAPDGAVGAVGAVGVSGATGAMGAAGATAAGGATFDEVSTMLSASQVAGTDVVELAARGTDRARLKQVLDVWLELYLAQRAAARQQVSSTTRDDLQRQVETLDRQREEKRRALEQFRARNEILSSEREDNEAATRLKQLTLALAPARQKMVEAEARVAAVRSDLAAGKSVLRAEDKPIVAGMENRARQLREELQEAGKRYSERFLTLDPKYKALRASLAELDADITRQRSQAARAVLDDAEQGLASARKNVEGLNAELEAHKRAAAEFTARYEEHKALQDELAQLESLHNATRDRLLRVGLASGQRAPEVQLLAPPLVAADPVGPLYLRDAGVSLGGALLLGLLAVWLYEFLRRTPREEGHGVPSIHITLPPQSVGPVLGSVQAGWPSTLPSQPPANPALPPGKT